jgi:hypothetical protein
MATVAYGFLAVLTSRRLTPKRRWLPYAVALVSILSIAFSRLYLGAHWLSDVLGGVALGSAWVALLGIAYVRHRPGRNAPAGLLPVSVAATMLAWGIHLGLYQSAQVARYAKHPQLRELALEQWWQQDWRRLPVYRTGLRGQRTQPLTLQWAAERPAIEAQLLRHGFSRPIPLSLTNSLNWLNPEARPADLPVHPQFLDGVRDKIRLVRPTADGRRLLFVRLWKSSFRLTPAQVPLWVGYTGYLEPRHLFSVLTWLRTGSELDAALDELRPDLATLNVRQERRQEQDRDPTSAWDGRVWLIRADTMTKQQ